MRVKIKLVYGVGMNDSKEPNQFFDKETGKQVWICPYYRAWKNMLERCYSPKKHAKFPTYIGCSTCDEWLIFSKFKAWMERQDWQGKHLDKDLLVKGNKVYSPSTCLFIDPIINTFINDGLKSKRTRLMGACFHKQAGKYQAECRNPFKGKAEYIGLFDSESAAHEAWKDRKLSLAIELARGLSSKVISDALISFYSS